MLDSTTVDVWQPEVRHDTLYSQQHGPIPTDSVSQVKINADEGGTSAGTIIGIVVGLSLGAVLAGEAGK